MNIRFHKNEEIDRAKWDSYIREAHNGLIYAESEFLDAMAGEWCALIDEASGTVWPLSLKKKLGITYSFQPPFAQQLGIFSKTELHEEVIKRFIEKAGEHFDLIDIYVNFQNPVKGAAERTNYILNLNKDFRDLSGRFRKDLITKPLSSGLQYAEGTMERMFQFYRQYIFPKNLQLTEEQLQHFERLASGYFPKRKALTRCVTSAEGEILSIGLFFIDDRRLYYMMGANSPEGRRLSANAFLIYEVIREFAGQELIFDFEGSEIPGVKAFFEKFSPKRQPYYYLIIDNLTPVQRAMKGLSEKLRGRK